jgi:dihydrofolate reductase
MRDVVLAMMTTLNGRLDDPGAWVTGVDDEQYTEIDCRYEGYDAILVGSTTYAEMFEYWPGALTDDQGFADSNAQTNRRMAEKMNSYKKYVFTRKPDGDPLEWNNSERVVATTDDDLVTFVGELKEQPGGQILLAGGAGLAQTFVRLGLVDEFRFLVYPLVSPGAAWFDTVATPPDLELVSATPYANGVVGLYYRKR